MQASNSCDGVNIESSDDAPCDGPRETDAPSRRPEIAASSPNEVRETGASFGRYEAIPSDTNSSSHAAGNLAEHNHYGQGPEAGTEKESEAPQVENDPAAPGRSEASFELADPQAKSNFVGSEFGEHYCDSAPNPDPNHDTVEPVDASHGKMTAAALRRIPDLKSTLAARMGKAANVSALASPAFGAVEPRPKKTDRMARLVTAITAPPVAPSLVMPERPSTQAPLASPARKVHLLVLAAASGAGLLAGALAGYVARGDSGTAHNTEVEKRSLQESLVKLKSEEQQLLAKDADAQKQIRELKRLLDEAASANRANKERLLAAETEHQRQTEELARLTDSAKAERQPQSQNSPVAGISGEARSSTAIAWPADPPKPDVTAAPPKQPIGKQKRKTVVKKPESIWPNLGSE